jgi:hypothetical protein
MHNAIKIKNQTQNTTDDATCNFMACVPSSNPARQFGVMPRRIQFSVVVDHATNYIVSFTVQPE